MVALVVMLVVMLVVILVVTHVVAERIVSLAQFCFPCTSAADTRTIFVSSTRWPSWFVAAQPWRAHCHCHSRCDACRNFCIVGREHLWPHDRTLTRVTENIISRRHANKCTQLTSHHTYINTCIHACIQTHITQHNTTQHNTTQHNIT